MQSAAAFTAAVLLVLAACGTSEPEALVVYSGRGEDLIGGLIDEFREESGIEVEVRYAGSTELAATLLEEGDNSPADVFFAQDPASLGSVAHLLEALPADILTIVPERFSDAAGRWVGTSGRARVLVYNPTLVETLPQSVWDLVEPEWSGRLGVAPTNGSFIAFVAAMILGQGEERTLEWLRGIAANDATDYPKNSPIVAATDVGEVDAGLVNHYYLFRLRAEQGGSVAENHFFGSGDAGALVMPAGAGVLATSENKSAAHEFVSFLLSDASQQYFAEETFEYPLVPDVPANPDLLPLSSINTPNIDLSELANVIERATDLIAESGLL